MCSVRMRCVLGRSKRAQFITLVLQVEGRASTDPILDLTALKPFPVEPRPVSALLNLGNIAQSSNDRDPVWTRGLRLICLSIRGPEETRCGPAKSCKYKRSRGEGRGEELFGQF